MAQDRSQKYTLVNPTTQPVAASFNGAPRLSALAGARIGLIDDSKRNADVLLEELVEVLRTRYEIGEVQWHRKPSASRPSDPAAMQELAQHCDAVVIAIGD
jgi:hypothetical protein